MQAGAFQCKLKLERAAGILGQQLVAALHVPQVLDLQPAPLLISVPQPPDDGRQDEPGDDDGGGDGGDDQRQRNRFQPPSLRLGRGWGQELHAEVGLAPVTELVPGLRRDEVLPGLAGSAVKGEAIGWGVRVAQRLAIQQELDPGDLCQRVDLCLDRDLVPQRDLLLGGR